MKVSETTWSKTRLSRHVRGNSRDCRIDLGKQHVRKFSAWPCHAHTLEPCGDVVLMTLFANCDGDLASLDVTLDGVGRSQF